MATNKGLIYNVRSHFYYIILILMYICIDSTCTFFDCQADSDVDNEQRRELVNFYGV